MKFSLTLLTAILFSHSTAYANPTSECSAKFSNQVEIGNCLQDVEQTVELTIQSAFMLAKTAAIELDKITERDVSSPALEIGQDAWSKYRDEHCDFVGTTYGGGSGTGITIRECRIELGRTRVAELMKYAE